WKKARILVKRVYEVTRVESFRKDYNLIDQMIRSAISIMANIAEGFARRTHKEFINFLGMAHGSTAELQSHLYVALDQNYLLDKNFNELYTSADEVSKLIQGFSNYLRNLRTPKLSNPKTQKPR
ncbi:MAG: four helix bundle protein, partial [candidate division WOR-3 bacterium]|nr:four helix bundle protein [candidate division WOR-3 bacterium]